MSQKYQTIIVGGGLAGILCAVKLRSQNVLLLEAGRKLGGKLKVTDEQKLIHNTGHNFISEKMWQYLHNSLLFSPDVNIPTVEPQKIDSIGVLSSGQMSVLQLSELIGQKGAKIIGGSAAVKNWAKVSEKLQEQVEKPQQFYKSCGFTVKEPAMTTLGYLSSILGIPEVIKSHSSCIRESVDFALNTRLSTDFSSVFTHILDNCPNLTCSVHNEVFSCKFENGLWCIESQKDNYIAEKLVIAHSPWDALKWFDSKYFPSSVLNYAMKARPVSTVSLTTQIVDPIDLPPLSLIQAEGSLAIKTMQNELVFQTPIDFELSLDAPSVVKAIKKLRRSLVKLKKAFPGLVTENEHLALSPTGWCQPTQTNESRYVASFNKMINSENLLFCGESYGTSYNPDQNIINSLSSIDGN